MTHISEQQQQAYLISIPVEYAFHEMLQVAHHVKHTGKNPIEWLY
jgi:hypothetical protein